MPGHHPNPSADRRFSFVLLVVFNSLVHPIVAASSAQQNPHPAPIEAALDLLRWLPADTPEIVVFDACPPGVNALAEAWTFFPREGNAKPVIYVAGWSELYRNALADPRNRHLMIRLAGVLAHERGHVRHGPDEEFAYLEQLTTLERLQAPRIDITNVRRALEAIRRQRGQH